MTAKIFTADFNSVDKMNKIVYNQIERSVIWKKQIIRSH